MDGSSADSALWKYQQMLAAVVIALNTINHLRLRIVIYNTFSKFKCSLLNFK
jgi:hypothetical protein